MDSPIVTNSIFIKILGYTINTLNLGENYSHLVLCNFGFYSERGMIMEEADLGLGQKYPKNLPRGLWMTPKGEWNNFNLDKFCMTKLYKNQLDAFFAFQLRNQTWANSFLIFLFLGKFQACICCSHHRTWSNYLRPRF